jgi:hypothetical protein
MSFWEFFHLHSSCRNINVFSQHSSGETQEAYIAVTQLRFEPPTSRIKVYCYNNLLHFQWNLNREKQYSDLKYSTFSNDFLCGYAYFISTEINLRLLWTANVMLERWSYNKLNYILITLLLIFRLAHIKSKISLAIFSNFNHFLFRYHVQVVVCDESCMRKWTNFTFSFL